MRSGCLSLNFWLRGFNRLSCTTEETILLLRVAPVEVIPSIASDSRVSNHIVANGRPYGFSNWSLYRQSLLNGAKIESVPRSTPVICRSLGVLDQRHTCTLDHGIFQDCCLALVLIVFCRVFFWRRLFLFGFFFFLLFF